MVPLLQSIGPVHGLQQQLQPGGAHAPPGDVPAVHADVGVRRNIRAAQLLLEGREGGRRAPLKQAAVAQDRGRRADGGDPPVVFGGVGDAVLHLSARLEVGGSGDAARQNNHFCFVNLDL